MNLVEDLELIETRVLAEHPAVRTIIYLAMLGLPIFFKFFHHIPPDAQTHATEWIKNFIDYGAGF